LQARNWVWKWQKIYLHSNAALALNICIPELKIEKGNWQRPFVLASLFQE
jgi:hypothetical protein